MVVSIQFKLISGLARLTPENRISVVCSQMGMLSGKDQLAVGGDRILKGALCAVRSAFVLQSLMQLRHWNEIPEGWLCFLSCVL